MNTFSLTLSDSMRIERFDNVTHFIGADDSGAFGILPHHARAIAVLRYGLARFLDSNGAWHYLAMPGGILRFSDNALTVTSARYFIGDERDLITDQLAAEMAQEDSEIHAARTTLTGIEQSLMRRLSEMSRQASGAIRR